MLVFILVLIFTLNNKRKNKTIENSAINKVNELIKEENIIYKYDEDNRIRCL